MKEQAGQGRVEGHWSQLGRVEDLVDDQEVEWGRDKDVLLVFVRKMRLRLVAKHSCCMKNLHIYGHSPKFMYEMIYQSK